MQEIHQRPNGKLSIFAYTNYRRFLKDYFDSEKKRLSKFSHRYFAKKAGLSTSNFLYLVIEGKRNLTEETIERFADAIGLSKRERSFFETMVRFNQTKHPQVVIDIVIRLKRCLVSASHDPPARKVPDRPHLEALALYSYHRLGLECPQSPPYDQSLQDDQHRPH